MSSPGERRGEDPDPSRTQVSPADPAAAQVSIAYSPTIAGPESGTGTNPAELPKGTVLGRYVLLDCLGEGGMGIVYAAYDPELDRRVALKLLLGAMEGPTYAERRARLLREAQAMARLSHPNVIAVHDVGTFNGQVFIAMEFVEGTTLTAWLREHERATPEIVAMFIQAGRGLAAAHAQGIVHRDFKPDNVLIGGDGRARVLDFGLAHAERAEAKAQPPGDVEAQPPSTPGSSTPSSLAKTLLEQEAAVLAMSAGEQPESLGGASLEPAVTALDARLTKTGAFMGTPMYMAPEQFLKKPTDARTDQFNFCVALYDALYRESPFAGDKVLERARHVVAGHVRDEPRHLRLPSGLRKVLLRGLSVRREDRFPSMQELLRAIEPRPPTNPWIWAGAVASLLLAGALGTFLVLRDKPGAVCEGGEQKLRGVWDGERKQAIHHAFLASGKPFAKDAFGGVERAVDAYANRWASMHREACVATRVHGEQSEELLDLRMECLSQRLEELRAISGMLASADAKLVERSVEAVQSLTGLEDCANASVLKAPVRPPPDGETRAKVESLRTRLAQIRALEHAGKFAEQRSVAESVAAEATRLKYRPIEAEALHALGKARSQFGERAEAEKNYTSALLAAAAGRHDVLAARIWLDLVGVQTGLDALDRARASSSYAAAMIERLGADEELSARFSRAAGGIAYNDAQYDDAIRHYRSALESYEKRFGPEHLEVAMMLHLIATAAHHQGNFGDAIRQLERALAIKEKAVGSDHPTVAFTLSHMGDTLNKQGKYEEAHRVLLRAVAIEEKAFGPDSPVTAGVLVNFANLLGDEGKFQEAIAIYERVLAIEEKTYGAGSFATAPTLNNIGATRVQARQFEAALPFLERAIRIQEKERGPSYPELAMARTNLGRALLELGRHKDAFAQFELSLQIAENAFGAEHPYVGDALAGIGRVHLAEHAPAQALPLLERALALRLKLDENPRLIAEARFLIARALWEKGTDRKRAFELAADAREILAKMGAGVKQELAEVQAWLHARPAPR